MTVSGRELLQSLKRGAGSPPFSSILNVGTPPFCVLRPVATRVDRLDARDVRCLTAWRNRFVSSFLTEFVATEEQTVRWLVEQVGKDDSRILFMVDDLKGVPFGYMGIAFIDWPGEYGEADAIVRGGDAPRGAMSQALLSLLEWARGELRLKDIGVRVRSDNPALKFYLNLGFQERLRVPLQRTTLPDRIVWSEAHALAASEKSLVHMRWRG